MRHDDANASALAARVVLLLLLSALIAQGQVAPTITAQPQGTNVCLGDSVRLVGAASGSETLVYQWRLAGLAIPGATGPELFLTNVQLTEQGGYDLVVANSVGAVTSIVAVVTVGVAPQVNVHPVGTTVSLGQPATLSVAATATPAPAYQWRRNGTVLAGATGSTLTIASARLADAGNYDVVVSNFCGAVISQVAALVMNAPVEISAQPATLTSCVGSNAVLSVEAAGTEPITYQWRFNHQTIPGATGPQLILVGVQSSQEGNYDVVVGNAFNTVTSAVAGVTVNVPPAVTANPASVALAIGQPAVFTVAATGKPAPAIQWRRNGVVIAGATSSTYAVAAAQLGDAGSYDAVVTNTCGLVTSSAAALAIVGPVTITTQPMSQTLRRGEALKLSVEATGSDPVAFLWRFNGTPIPGATGPALHLAGISASQAGNYDVVVTNPLGSATSAVAVVAVTVTLGILNQPGSVIVLPGRVAMLSAVAEGTGTLSYQWSRDGRLLPGSTNALLAIANVTTNDSGAYRVAVSDSTGSVTSDAAFITVAERQVKLADVQPSVFSEGTAISIPVSLIGDATENLLSFSVAYATNSLVFVTVDGRTAGATVTTTHDAGAGVLGVTVALPPGQGFFPGSNAVAELQFRAASITGQLVTPLIMRGTPVATVVTDTNSVALVAAFAGGSVIFKGSVPATVSTASGLRSETIVLETPPGGGAATFVRVLIHDLGADSLGNPIRVMNATGTNAAGIPFIVFPSTVAPGQRIEFALEYYVSDRVTLPAPRFALEMTTSGLPTPPVDGVVLQPEQTRFHQDRFHIDFRSARGRQHFVQYAASLMGPWETSFPPVIGTGSVVQWIDSGPPRTTSLPTTAGQRFYRVIQVP